MRNHTHFLQTGGYLINYDCRQQKILSGPAATPISTTNPDLTQLPPTPNSTSNHQPHSSFKPLTYIFSAMGNVSGSSFFRNQTGNSRRIPIINFLIIF